MRTPGEQIAYAHGFQRGALVLKICTEFNGFEEALKEVEKRIQFVIDEVEGAQWLIKWEPPAKKMRIKLTRTYLLIRLGRTVMIIWRDGAACPVRGRK